MIWSFPLPSRGDPVPAERATRIVAVPRPGQIGPLQAGAIGPLSLLRALRRRSALALGVALLATGIAAPAAWYLIPLAYKAEARLQVAVQPPKVVFSTVETQGAGGGDEYKRYQSTQQTLVKSSLVLAAALRDRKVANFQMVRNQVDPIEWLQEKLKVEFVAGSEVMEISLNGGSPDEVAGIVNAVKKAYMDEVVNFDLKRRTERFDRLKKIKDNYAEMLKKKREIMRNLAESVGSDDRQTLALRQQYAMEHLHYLQKELLDIQSQRRKVEAQIKLLRPGEASGPAAEPAPPPSRRSTGSSRSTRPSPTWSASSPIGSRSSRRRGPMPTGSPAMPRPSRRSGPWRTPSRVSGRRWPDAARTCGPR